VSQGVAVEEVEGGVEAQVHEHDQPRLQHLLRVVAPAPRVGARALGENVRHLFAKRHRVLRSGGRLRCPHSPQLTENFNHVMMVAVGCHPCPIVPALDGVGGVPPWSIAPIREVAIVLFATKIN
jgi:hypothetical protein